jgi:hypothetical protein
MDSTENEHPKNRAWEPEDPMLLQAQPVNGDPDVMLECLIEEFARLGYDEAEIKRLFDQPFFQATYGLKGHYGEKELARRIQCTLARSGVMRFTALPGANQPDTRQRED